jgi:hypothetical protein
MAAGSGCGSDFANADPYLGEPNQGGSMGYPVPHPEQSISPRTPVCPPFMAMRIRIQESQISADQVLYPEQSINQKIVVEKSRVSDPDPHGSALI